MVLLLGQQIASPVVILVVFVVALIGSTIVSKIAFKKWGYTREREKELEEMKNPFEE